MREHAQHLVTSPPDVAAGVLTQLCTPAIRAVLEPLLLLVAHICGVQVALQAAARHFAFHQSRELVQCELSRAPLGQQLIAKLGANRVGGRMACH
jgi:hypothetical protein